MSPTLIQKIESLPPAKQAEVETFVDHLSTQSAADLRDLVAKTRARREQLLQEKGLFDMTPLIREFRETGR